MRQVLVIAAVLILASTALAQDARLERDGISFALAPGAEVIDRTDAGGRQTYVRWDEGALVVRFLRGPEMTSPPVGPSTPATICGRAATRAELATPRSEAYGSYLDEDGTVRHMPPSITPARVDVVLTFALADGTPASLGWSVLAERRRELAARERAFFASIRCR